MSSWSHHEKTKNHLWKKYGETTQRKTYLLEGQEKESETRLELQTSANFIATLKTQIPQLTEVDKESWYTLIWKHSTLIYSLIVLYYFMFWKLTIQFYTPTVIHNYVRRMCFS